MTRTRLRFAAWWPAAVLIAAGCGGARAPQAEPAGPPEPPEPAAATRPAPEPAAAMGPARAPEPDADATAPASEPTSDELLAAERAAYERAAPVFAEHCAHCHTPRPGRAKQPKGVAHFSMGGYPFGGHHAGELPATIRKVLGATGDEPTMPKDDPGAVRGDELAAILAWADAFDRAEAAGAHGHAAAGEHGHGGHDPDHGHGGHGGHGHDHGEHGHGGRDHDHGDHGHGGHGEHGHGGHGDHGHGGRDPDHGDHGHGGHDPDRGEHGEHGHGGRDPDHGEHGR